MSPDLQRPIEPPDALSLRAIATAAGMLAAALLVTFFDTIILGNDTILSAVGCDIYAGTLPARDLLFTQLRNGHFPLWSPSVFCGTPCFGGFQTGLLYPPSILYLLLPAAQAMNWEFILHLFLGGLFMYLWLGRQSLHRHACLAGALMFMFSAPFYLRLYAGHVAPHSTITWIPLVFLAIDGLVASPRLGWMLLATGAAAMELLGGYPQVLFYTALIAVPYALIALRRSPRPFKALILMAAASALALGLTCAQWAAGIAMSGECVRQGGVSYDFAAMLSLPPENWLTLIRPGLFGDMTTHPYWGRWYLWEMCLYFGTTGLFFAAAGLTHSARRRVVLFATFAVATAILAMGAHSPHFTFFYNHVPGFNLFRSNSKFIILTVVFLIVLSAHGLDRLFRNESPRIIPRLLAAATGVAVLLALVWMATIFGPADWMAQFIAIPVKSGQIYFDPAPFSNPAVVARATAFMAGEWALAFMFMAAVAALLLAAWKRPAWRAPLMAAWIGLIAAELLLFARRDQASFDPAILRSTELESFLKANLGDGRIFSPDGSNVSLTMPGVSDLWGYGSDSVIRRYAEFMAWTQGENPDAVTGYQLFHVLHPRFDLLRCKYMLTPQPGGGRKITELKNPLPRFLAVADWRVVPNRDTVFALLAQTNFSPRATVLLERAPAGWAPSAHPITPPVDAAIRIIDETTDRQDVEITLSQPAILLQTDLYTPNWHVSALPGSSQTEYELIPADYILRAIPLQAGAHRLRIEYSPVAFTVGKWVSWVSLALFIALAIVAIKSRERSTWRAHPA